MENKNARKVFFFLSLIYNKEKKKKKILAWEAELQLIMKEQKLFKETESNVGDQNDDFAELMELFEKLEKVAKVEFFFSQKSQTFLK